MSASVFTLIFFVIVTVALAIVVPIFITNIGAQVRKDDPDLEAALNNPRVKRAILRVEVAGIVGGTLAICLGVWGVYETSFQSRLAKESLAKQELTSAWQLMESSGEARTAKAHALEVLLRNGGQVLSNLDFSCRNIERPPEGEFSNCPGSIMFYGSTFGNPVARSSLSHSSFDYAKFSGVTFHNMELFNLSMRNTTPYSVQFHNSTLNSIRFDGARNDLDGSPAEDIWYSDAGIKVVGSKMLHMDLKIDAFNLSVENSVVQEVYFSSASDLIDGKKTVIKSSEIGFISLKGLNLSDNNFRLIDSDLQNSSIDVSGAVLCSAKDKCWNDIDSDLIKSLWYYEDMVPTGL